MDAACELMHNRGYGSIGVAEICASADVRKGSFYHFFESKQALTMEVIDMHWARQRAVWIAVLGADCPALHRIERLVRSQVDGQRSAKESLGVVNGCLLGNLALELSTQDALVQRRLAEVFEEQIAMVEAVLVEAESEGTIPTGRTNARGLLAQVEGMVLFAKLANDPDLLDDLWAHTRMLLGTVPEPARAR